MEKDLDAGAGGFYIMENDGGDNDTAINVGKPWLPEAESSSETEVIGNIGLSINIPIISNILSISGSLKKEIKVVWRNNLDFTPNRGKTTSSKYSRSTSV